MPLFPFAGLPLTIVFISACSRWGGYGNERAYVYVTSTLISDKKNSENKTVRNSEASEIVIVKCITFKHVLSQWRHQHTVLNANTHGRAGTRFRLCALFL